MEGGLKNTEESGYNGDEGSLWNMKKWSCRERDAMVGGGAHKGAARGERIATTPKAYKVAGS